MILTVHSVIPLFSGNAEIRGFERSAEIRTSEKEKSAENIFRQKKNPLIFFHKQKIIIKNPRNSFPEAESLQLNGGPPPILLFQISLFRLFPPLRDFKPVL